jgi:hypothetical protein
MEEMKFFRRGKEKNKIWEPGRPNQELLISNLSKRIGWFVFF